MLSYVAGQLRHRAGRALVLGLGLLIAAVSFSLLTSAVQTSSARVVGKVSANFRGSYDLLIRPRGARTAVEQSRGLVEPNFLSGIFGGISMAQYHRIQHIAGVQVAAPVAMVGYVMPFVNVPIDVTKDLGSGRSHLLRVTASWSTDRGLSTYPDAASYVYASSDKGVEAACVRAGMPRFYLNLPISSSPFAPASRTAMQCWQDQDGHRDPIGGPPNYPVARNHVASAVAWPVPMLIAAIDPAAEQKLDGLGGAMLQGHYLPEGVGASLQDLGGGLKARTVPVIAASQPLLDEQLHVAVQQLPDTTPAQLKRLLSAGNSLTSLGQLPGQRVDRYSMSVGQTYQQLLQHTSSGQPIPDIGNYWTVSPVTYPARRADLVPTQQSNPPGVWTEAGQASGFSPVPLESEDVQFRTIHEHLGSNAIVDGVPNEPAIRVVGRYDSSRLVRSGSLNQLPLGAFQPAGAQPADARSQQLLHGQGLLPSPDIGGLLNQPPTLLTTLQALPAFTNRQYFTPTDSAAPISTIRVRVAGVHGTDAASRARLRDVATLIAQATGLEVDITAGASPAAQTLILPAGHHGRPALTLTQPWVQKHVAFSIDTAVNRESLTLFLLILLATGCFLTNGALAAQRSRREELGVLLCLGWSRPRIFTAMLSELALVGAGAGAIGAGLAAAIITALSLHLTLWYTALIAPVAVVLAVTAGLGPALLATRGSPLDAVAPAVTPPRRASRPRTIAALAWAELRRTPARLAVATVPLVVGIGALTVLLTTELRFHHAVNGTLLGSAINTQTRTVDIVTVALVIALAAASVADTLTINVREKARDLAVLQSGGWSSAHIARYVTYQGLAIGTLGGALGASAGIAISAALTGTTTLTWLAALIAAAAGILVAALASLAPTHYATHRPLAASLAAE